MAVPAKWPAPLVPNFSDWSEADIVLVGNDGTAAGNLIVTSQYASISAATRAGALYTHAALYIGNGMLIDSTAKVGIAARPVWEYCKDRQLTVRRVPGLSDAETSQIVSKAKSHDGKAYSWFQLIASKFIPLTEPHPEHLYCSTFVGLVVAQGSGRKLSSQWRHRPLHPGTLAGHGGLDTVLLEWRPA